MTTFIRSLLLVFALVLAAGTAVAQGRIVFEDTTHVFGPIAEGEVATHVFTFRNAGDAPLHLQNVRPSCGCTTPAWPRDAVAPGETGEITVAYDSEGYPGPFHKSILVMTDGAPADVTLTIEGDVRAQPLADTHRQGDLRIDRAVVDVGALRRGIASMASFRVQNAGEEPLRFVEVVEAPSNVYVALPPEPLPAAEIKKINLVIGTDALEPGQPLDYTLVLRTDDAAKPLKRIRVTGTVKE